ncbi:MAG: CPBP family intramembrane glutamic endopeptidase [Oscillochloridaceae bacterium]|nr:CPBP family intramembrane metalloprotease [Chloroflexaceae bacterium]MDW8392028.1 CPBP family intramembrane glutamic endopeptidase [Oscillochloridaceae bacterium]
MKERMPVTPSRYAQHGLLALPLALAPVMAGVFALGARWLGAEAGYLLGFGLYWLVWCLLVPRALLGKAGFATLLRDRAPLFSRNNWLAACLWLLVTLSAVFMYAGAFLSAPPALILLAAPLATVNGVCEELLWRSLYARCFPRNPWLAIVYPAIGFALWHLAPQMVFPAGNVAGFVLATFFLGLSYGFIAYRTGSARWTAVSHSLSGALALSGYLATSLLALIEA